MTFASCFAMNKASFRVKWIGSSLENEELDILSFQNFLYTSHSQIVISPLSVNFESNNSTFLFSRPGKVEYIMVKKKCQCH